MQQDGYKKTWVKFNPETPTSKETINSYINSGHYFSSWNPLRLTQVVEFLFDGEVAEKNQRSSCLIGER